MQNFTYKTYTNTTIYKKAKFSTKRLRECVFHTTHHSFITCFSITMQTLLSLFLLYPLHSCKSG